MNRALISVAWPYANGDLHLGHIVGTQLPATIFNDYLRLRGTDVIMVSGSDMHGTPVAVKAWKEGKKPGDFAGEQHIRHAEVLEKLGMDYSLYTTTATSLHEDVVQAIFKRLSDNGYISKKESEQYWSEIEHKFLLDRYIEGECPHCHFAKARGDQCDNCGHTLTPEELVSPYSIFGDKQLAKKKSTNYYLDLDKLQPKLEEFYNQHPNLTNWRKHVVATTNSWLKEGLQPRAISRDMEGYGVQLPLGYEVAGEEGKVIYVWFEAVSGYFTASVELSVRHRDQLSAEQIAILQNTLGVNLNDLAIEEHKVISSKYPGQSLNWADYWLDGDVKHYYFMGKDNIPFHTIIWPAMLIGLNLDLNLPWDVPANQYLNLSGSKFSKSTGNFIRAIDFLDDYSSNSVRFFLLSRMPQYKDYDFTWPEFIEANNNELVANLGNFIHRSLSFWNRAFAGESDWSNEDVSIDTEVKSAVELAFKEIGGLLDMCKFNEAWERLLVLSTFANKYFNDQKIWSLVKENSSKSKKVMSNIIYLVANLGLLVKPMLPELSAGVYTYLKIDSQRIEVGLDNWKAINVDLTKIGTIADLIPLVEKLEPDEVSTK